MSTTLTELAHYLSMIRGDRHPHHPREVLLLVLRPRRRGHADGPGRGLLRADRHAGLLGPLRPRLGDELRRVPGTLCQISDTNQLGNDNFENGDEVDGAEELTGDEVDWVGTSNKEAICTADDGGAEGGGEAASWYNN